MFEFGLDQAAGLRLDMQGRDGSPALMPLASPAQPSRGFEWLCRLAMALADAGQRVVVLDACASERGDHGGLVHAMADAGVANLGHDSSASHWPVMPAAHGVQTLVGTARAGGADIALSRLFSPFAAGTLILLYAPAQALAGLLQGVSARVMVPVIEQPQASIDAYGSLKWLHGAGLCPVLAPLDASAQVLGNVVDTAHRHLGLRAPVWAQASWAQRVPDGALVRADAAPFSTQASPARGPVAGAGASLWS